MPARGRRGRTGGRPLAIAGLLLLATILTAAALRQLARSTTAQLFGRIVARVPTQDSVVALTFDDGPVAAVLGELLDTLGSRGVRATFFVTGAELARSPGAGRALIAAGHELGNHSYSHPRLVLVSSGTVRREVEATDSLLEAAGQRVPIYFRPPYGYKLVGLPLYLARTERTTVTWDVAPDSDGKAAKTADGIVRHVLERVRPGSIILLHPWYASRATTRQALPTLLDSLLGRGYRLTTVGDLLGQAPTRGPTDRWSRPGGEQPRHGQGDRRERRLGVRAVDRHGNGHAGRRGRAGCGGWEADRSLSPSAGWRPADRAADHEQQSILTALTNEPIAMSGEPVVLRTFANETEAELARAILESEGIPSLVHSAGAAGMLLFVQGVQLVVRREDAEAAHEALARQDEERAD